MGFVDGDERHGKAPEPCVGVGQQPFGRQIQYLDLSGYRGFGGCAVVALGLARVDGGRRYAVGDECLHLILHQRNQGRHYDCRAFQQQGRHLVA